MKINVAINGFGRIGRLTLRAFFERKIEEFNIIAINDLGDIKSNIHLLKYDSVHGTFPLLVKDENDSIEINNKKIHFLKEANPVNLPWKKLGIDLVIESTGVFTDREKAEMHLDAGANRVIISAPSKNPDITVVFGINHQMIKDEHKIISNGSCTTNCLAPIAKVLDDNFGIKSGLMTTVHAYTNDQALAETTHSDFRRGRSATQNIIPTSTGAAKAVGMVLPELNGKLDGMAMRVPVPNGSVVDLVVELEKSVTIEDVNIAVKQAADNELKGILEYSEIPLVSTDILNNPHSSIYDASSTQLLDGNHIKVVCWYDNEWGYSNRVVDLIGNLLNDG